MTLCRCLMAVYVVTKKGVAILGVLRWHPGFERPREQQRTVPECATRSLSIFNRQSAIGNSHVPVPMHRGPVPTFFVGMRHPRKAHDPALRDRAYPPRVSF
jgi:hypothetical protein